MGNVLRMDLQKLIFGLLKLGHTDRSIHRTTGIHRTTISNYRKKFESVPEAPTDLLPQTVPQVPTDTMLPANGVSRSQDQLPLPSTHSQQIVPHREVIRAKLNDGLSAQRIYQDLVEYHSYNGSYDSVKRYVHKFKDHSKPYYDRLPTKPGHEAQVDFAKSPCKVLVNGKYRHIWFFKMTLSHCKHSYEELVARQDTETFIRCHENAFKAFYGVPETVKLDNCKAGVIQACIYDPLVNPVYQAFADHYGFIPNPCAPMSPEHKGRVERDIQYTESNALKGLRFESIEEGNLYLRHWNKRWARTRIHGTTKCQVWKMFVESEQPALKPLAEHSFSLFTVCDRKVDVNGFVEVECNFYSAPTRFIGEYVMVYHNSIDVKIFDTSNKMLPPQLLIRHLTINGKGRCSQTPDCKPKWKHPSLESQEMFYCRKAKGIGPCCYLLVNQILTNDHPLSIRRVRGILALEKTFTQPVIEQACSEAIYRKEYNYRFVRGLCDQLVKKGDCVQSSLTQDHEAIRPIEEYAHLIEERIMKQ